MNDDRATNTFSEIFGAVVIRGLIPLHLLIGAAMKYWSASPDALPRIIQNKAISWFGPLEAAGALLTFLKVVLIVEIVAAAVILLLPRLSRAMAIGILGVFMLVLLAEISHLSSHPDLNFFDAAFSGDCGCFGKLASVPPGVMLLIDGILLLGAAVLPMRTTPLASTPKWAVAALLLWVAAGAGLAMNPLMKSGSEETEWSDRMPRTWVGKHVSETPLGQAIDELTGAPADHEWYGGGKQKWVLYSKTCSVCHHYFDTNHAAPTDETVVAVWVPPSPSSAVFGEEKEIICTGCHFAKLPEGEDWLIGVPTIILVDEQGIITRVIDLKLEAAADDEKEV